MHQYFYKSTAGTVNKTFLHHVSTPDSNVGHDGLCSPPPLGTDVARQTSARQTSARQTSALTYEHTVFPLYYAVFGMKEKSAKNRVSRGDRVTRGTPKKHLDMVYWQSCLLLVTRLSRYSIDHKRSPYAAMNLVSVYEYCANKYCLDLKQ